MPIEHYDDPVAAYERLAPVYAIQSGKRELYLRGIEREIVARIPQGSQSLLDIGAGDGLRAARIAKSAGIARVVLVEPSAAMASLAKSTADVWHMRAEDLDADAFPGRFDMITCLWNVLGHVRSRENRGQTLKAMAKLLSSRGRLFVDVNHRYNARAYGWIATSGRWVYDFLMRNVNTGDVTATWDIGEGDSISTYGHVFRHREIVELAEAAELEIEERILIDYDDGSVRRLPWQGNLLYILRRTSRTDSSSAPATS